MKEIRDNWKDIFIYGICFISIVAAFGIGYGRMINERKVCDKLGGTYTLITGCYIN